MKKGFAFFAFLSMSVLCLIWGGVLTSCKHSGSSGPASLDLTMYSDSKNAHEIDSLSYTVGEDVPKFYIQSLNYPNKDQIELDEASYILGNDEGELDPDEDVTVAYKKSQKNYKITLNNPPQQPGSYDFMLLFSATNGEECELEFTLKVSRKGDNGETIEGAKPIITKNLKDAAGAESVTLEVEATVADNADITYQWYTGDGKRIKDATKPSYNVKETGAYYVKVTANNQTVQSETANVTIGSVGGKIPKIIINTVEPYKIENGTLKVPEASEGKLSITVEDGNADSYEWYISEETSGSDAAVTGASASIYTPDKFANYYCKVFVSGGASYQSSTVKVIEKDIVMSLNPNFGENAYIGGGALSVKATTDVPCDFSYQWYKEDETSGNPETMSGATSEDYSPTKEGHYYCKVTAKSRATGAKKSLDTNKVYVREKTANDPNTPTVESITGTKDLSEGDTLTLSVTASTDDGGILSYQWYKGNNSIIGATKATYEKRGATPEDSGEYKCRVTNTLSGKTADATSSSVTVLVRHNVIGGNTSGNANGSFDFN